MRKRVILLGFYPSDKDAGEALRQLRRARFRRSWAIHKPVDGRIRVDGGPLAFLMFVFVIKSSDIGAYTFGKLFGRHKLAPRVSPGKTWEGLGGAVVFAALVSLAFGAVSGIMGVLAAPVFGAIMAVVGQLSDLSESMLKRDAQQKDSSNRVPGFGGILDVIDSPLFAAPCAYLFLTVLA